jgi:trimeric autotransporter adhesin
MANNKASSKTTLSGGAVAAKPVVTSLSPNAVHVGSGDVAITVTGTGFTSGSTVNWAGTALNTSLISGTQLLATVPSASLANLGWAPVTVSTPAPGGGVSNPVAFTIFNTVKLQANHLAVEPFTGRLYATVNSSATEVTGNSLVVLDPVSGKLGTPVSVGSQPSSMAISDDGAVMYIAQTGAGSVGRFDIGSGTLQFSFPVGVVGSYSPSPSTVNGVNVVPGTENTVAVNLDNYSGVALYDVDPAGKTAKTRVNSYGQNASGAYTGAGLEFLDPTTAFTADGGSATGSLFKLAVTPTGFTGGYDTMYTLNNFGTFQIHGGIGYSDNGGVADLTVTPPLQKGVFLQAPASSGYTYSYYSTALTAADPSLQRSFFTLPPLQSTSNSGTTMLLDAFDQNTYTQTDALAIPYTVNTSQSSTNTGLANIDFVRWGQDGLAVLMSDGQILLMRGAFVVPALLGNTGVASVTSLSQATLAHGSANTTLTLTGTGFVRGAGVFWNGSYRTTNYVDSGHLSFDVSAADLATAGSASVTVVNPGAAASNAVSATVN